MRLFKSKELILYAVEILGETNQPSFSLSMLTLKAKRLVLKDHHPDLIWEVLLSLLPEFAPTFWLINDHEVLCKAKWKNNQIQPLDLLFPNLDRASFFISETTDLFSICRKDHWMAWREKIIASRRTISQLSVGLSPLTYFIDQLPEEMVLERHKVFVKEGKVSALSVTEKSPQNFTNIGDEKIRPTAVLGFAMVVGFLSEHSLSDFSIFQSLIKSNLSAKTSKNFEFHQKETVYSFLNDFFYQRLIRHHSKILGLFLIIGILISLWSSSTKKHFNSLSKSHQEISLNLKKKDSFLMIEKDKWKRVSKKSKMRLVPLLDGILQKMPNKIKLDRITFSTLKKNNFPLLKKQQYNQVNILGEMKSKDQLSRWVENIRTQEKIKELSISHISTDDNLMLRFELHIAFHNEY